MFQRQFLTLFVALTLTAISAQVYAAPPTAERSSSSSVVLNKELADLNNVENSKKQREKTQEDLLTGDDESSSSASSSRSYEHRDEDQLNNATNLVLAQNLKYDVEILESNDNDDDRYQNNDDKDLEERFRGDGLKMTDTIYAQNIEVEPIDVNSRSIQQSHLMLSIVLVALALLSVGLYAALVIWRSHLEQRYGMRQLLVSSGDDEQQQQQSQSEPPHPYPSNPTTTRSNNHYTLVQA